MFTKDFSESKQEMRQVSIRWSSENWFYLRRFRRRGNALDDPPKTDFTRDVFENGVTHKAPGLY